MAAALPSRPAEVVLPSSLSGWLLEQPDSVASVWHAHDDQLHGKYLFLGPRTLGDPFHVRVVHRHLARHLPGKLADMSEEVAIAVDKVFGEAGKAPAGGGDAGDASDGPWTEYNIWHSLLAVVPRVMNRMLLGLPLCRDERLLNAFMEFADHVIPCSMLLDMTPAILHPLMGRFLGLKSWECWRRVRDLSLSIIQPRVDRMLAEEEARAKAKGDEKQPRNRPPPPEDFITWSVRTALAEGNDFELDPEQISKRLMPINFAGIHTTVLVLHAFLLNLASSDPAEDVIGQLRREIASVLAESPELYPMAPPTPTSGSAKPLPISSANSTRPSHAAAFAPRWTKAALSRLHLLDSALRESLRFSSFNLTGVERKIVAPEGLTLPESAFLTSKPPPSARDRTIPFGSLVSFNIAGVHLDPAVVPSGTSSESSKENGKKMRTKGPDEFDAFRFARERARLEAMTPEDEAALGWATGDATLKALRLSMTTTSESYLPFGHGRHAW